MVLNNAANKETERGFKNFILGIPIIYMYVIPLNVNPKKWLNYSNNSLPVADKLLLWGWCVKSHKTKVKGITKNFLKIINKNFALWKNPFPENHKFNHKTLLIIFFFLNPVSANFTKWSNTLKQFVGKLPTNCLSVFHHFVGLVLKGLSGFTILTARVLQFQILKMIIFSD